MKNAADRIQSKTRRIHTENNDFQLVETLKNNRLKRHKTRLFFVEGVRSINCALQNGWKVDTFVYSFERKLSDWATDLLSTGVARAHLEMPDALMQKLSDKEETSELIAIIAMPADALSRIPVRPDLLVVVFDRPSNPGNLGSIIRSCDALNASGLIITGHSVDPYDPQTIRGTTGSFFSVPVVRLPSHKELEEWIAGLRRQMNVLQVIGTSAKATDDVESCDFSMPTIVVVGNETHGLSEHHRMMCDTMAGIPISGTATSLNVACATSIVLYEIGRQRRKL